MLAARPCDAKAWKTKENCKLISNAANDGDSFHVRWHDREYIFRLYFVDTPESDDSLPDRVKEQAAYFGIDEKASVRLGKEAAKFTQDFLKGEFVVYTKLDDARGRSEMDRDYAFVEADGKDLGEELVAHGLARIYGMEIEPPDGTATAYTWRLKSAERDAKKLRLGGWAAVGPESPMARFNERNATPEIAEQDVMLKQSIAVFSLKEPYPQIGILQRDAKVHVIKATSATMVHIRFSASSGAAYEAQCRRADLGL